MTRNLAPQHAVESYPEMSLASPQAEARNTRPLPMPPPGGWTLSEAADVLSLRLARLYRARSPESELEAVMD